MSNTYQAPPMQKSEESTLDQLDMAREQGKTYVKALDFMVKHEADTGGEKKAGNYIIGYAIENAEGMYELMDGRLEWQEPGENNCHIEISVRDGADHRFIPGLKVTVTLKDMSGKEIGSHVQEFLWHPWLYHYGRNWQVPRDGLYNMRVHIEAPKFMRHDHKNGLRYIKDEEVVFEEITVKTGQKK